MPGLLSNVFKINAAASATFGLLMVVPSLSKVFWPGLGIEYNKDSAAISLFWGGSIQFVLGALQYHLGQLSDARERVFFGKLHAVWWAVCATSVGLVSPGGPLVLPNVLGMLGLSGLFGYASITEEGGEDNKKD